ncbi:helix-turn-helix domain-containing protein [Corynebacterium glyciniphilum]|uniref:helix-turn-helix domain-containing protein n=1 Tax=Corynebacterium glyciniphilum TaxID=1404244 RepID=UPI003DA198B0
MTGLQDVVEGLADRLGRSVALNDYDLSLIAASAQDREVDEYRVQSILTRRTPVPIIRLLHDGGYLDRTDPFLLEGGLLPGLQPRLCVPITVKGRTVAFVWILLREGEGEFSPADYATVRQAAEEITGIIGSASPNPVADRVMEGSRLLQRLILTDTVAAGYAVTELAEDWHLDDRSTLTVTVFDMEVGDRPDVSELKNLAGPAFTALGSPSLLASVDGTYVLVTARTDALTLGGRIDRSFAGASSGGASGVRVRASGSSSTTEWRSGLRTAYLEASYATRLAGRVPEAPKHARFADLGALVLFRGLPWRRSSVDLICPEARTVELAGEVNVASLLTYLREGRDVPRTCEALRIHRSTLYYRLDRCREFIGDALDNGWRSSSLYLGLVLTELLAAEGR